MTDEVTGCRQVREHSTGENSIATGSRASLRWRMRSSAPLPRAPWRLSRSARCSAGLTAPVLRGWRAPVLRQRASSSLTPLTRDRGAAVPLGVREQSLKTPERLLELSKRLSKVADDFEVRARVGWARRRLLPASARPNASAPTAHLPRAPGLTTEPAGGPLRTPPHTPGAAYAAGAAGHRGEPDTGKAAAAAGDWLRRDHALALHVDPFAPRDRHRPSSGAP